MRVIRKTPRDFVPKPWKNGLGVTREIHIHPEGANFEEDSFLWRLSSADVTAGGPFLSSPAATGPCSFSPGTAWTWNSGA